MAAALVAFSVSSAMAGFTVTPGGTQNSAQARVSDTGVAPNNSSFTFNFAGTDFTPGDIVITGDLTDGGQSGNWANDARIEICNPSVCVVTPGLTSTQTYTGTISINATVSSGGLLTGSSLGTWTFETYEAFDEGGAAGVDNIWSNLSIDIQDFVPPSPPAAIDLGNIGAFAGETLTGNATYTPGEVTWYKFTLTSAVDSANLSALSLSTYQYGPGGVNPYLTGGQFGNNDTEIALFDSLGNLVTGGNNDDSSGNRESFLLYGADNSATNPQGTSGGGSSMLAAGTYYLAVSPYNLGVAAGWSASVSPAGTPVGDLPITLRYIPEPATLTLLSFGLFGLIRRRR